MADSKSSTVYLTQVIPGDGVTCEVILFHLCTVGGQAKIASFQCIDGKVKNCGCSSYSAVLACVHSKICEEAITWYKSRGVVCAAHFIFSGTVIGATFEFPQQCSKLTTEVRTSVCRVLLSISDTTLSSSVYWLNKTFSGATPNSTVVAELFDSLASQNGFIRPEREVTFTPEAVPEDSLYAAYLKDAPVGGVFKVETSVWEQVAYCLAFPNEHLMLTGPSGCGKTELIRHAASKFKRPFFSFNFGAMTDPRLTLIGNTVYHADTGTKFIPSTFIEAITTPNAVVMLDELSRCSGDAFNILLPLLDGQRYLSLDESEDKARVTLADGVSILATANIGSEYTGTMVLDKALMNRFTVVKMDFPSESGEAEVIHHRTKLHKAVCSLISKVCWEQRKGFRDGSVYSAEISTRAAIKTAQQLVRGVSWLSAVNHTLLGDLSDAGGNESDFGKAVALCKKHFSEYVKQAKLVEVRAGTK